MRRVLEREDQERRPQEQGGKTWRDIANGLDHDLRALEGKMHDLEQDRHATDVALRTLVQDVLHKADELLKLGKQHNELLLGYNKLQLEYRELRRKYEGSGDVDVEAEVEPEEQSTQA